jgi:hypothetical protein
LLLWLHIFRGVFGRSQKLVAVREEAEKIRF